MRAYASPCAKLAIRREASQAENYDGKITGLYALSLSLEINVCDCNSQQDRPDLIQSELAGLAFDSLQQVFRKGDIHLMFETEGWPLVAKQTIWIVIDPAAGGPQSDYAVVSICRHKGCVQVKV